MTVRRLLVGLFVLALLAVLLFGILDSSDTGSTGSFARPADAFPPAGTSGEPPPEFPDAELEAGLVALCSNDASGSTEAEPPQTYEEMARTVSERLVVSSSADDLLAAALLERDPESQMDLVKRAVAAGPTNPLVLWSAVRICSDAGDSPDSFDSPDCPLREWGQRLIAVDGQNSEAWIHVAANRYAVGEVDSALEAMRFASTAADSSIYWTEMIELIERALRVGDFDFPERAQSAIGTAAASLPRYSGMTTMCREQSPASVEWADACLKYGELAEIRGETVIGVFIALSIQRLVLEAAGESERAAEVEERRRARGQEFADATIGLNATAELMMQSPSLFYSYLAAIRSEGEVAAARRVTAEIERLIQQRPELACE